MEVQSFYNVGSLVNLAITMATILGGFYVYKKAVIKATSEIHEKTALAQGNTIAAMEQQIDALESKIQSLEKENRRQDQIIMTLCDSLKSRGLEITVSGNMVNIRDGNQTSSVRISDK